MSDTPELVIVKEVKWEHGEKFAETWRDESLASEAMMDAFTEAGVMTWPDDPELHSDYSNIENEILTRTFDAIRYAAVEAFVRIAGEVLARERGR